MTIDGRLYEGGSTSEPLLDPNVNIRIQVLNPAKSCILYEEQQNVSTLSTSGYFNIQVGSIVGDPKRTSLDSLNTMRDVFYNRTTAITGKTSIGAGCTYTPTAMEERYFRFLITPSTVGSTNQLSPDMLIDSVPQAIVAQTLQGLGPNDVFRTSVTSTQSRLDNILTTNYTNLTSLIAGTSTAYLQNNSNGTQLPTRPSDPSSPSAGQVWYDTTANQIKFYNGSSIQTLGVAGSGISSLTAGSGLDGGTITTSGTISVATSGIVNTMLASGIDASKITTGTLPVGVVPTNTDTTKLPLAGGTLTGALTLGASTNFANFDLLNLGHVTMTSQRTFRFGQFTNLQQASLVGTPLTAGQAGSTWFNTDTGKLMYWNGSQEREVADMTSAGGDITAINTNAGSGLSGGALSGAVTLQVDITGATSETSVTGLDEILIYDVSATALRKMTRTNFVLSEAEVDAMVSNNGYLSTEADTLATITGRGSATATTVTMSTEAAIRFEDAAGGQYVGLKSPATVASSFTLVLPDNVGNANEVLRTDGSGVMSWMAIPAAPVSTVHGRVGAVVSANGDYTASQVTNVPAGTVGAVTVQAAIDELDTEKVPATRTIATTASTSGLSGGGDLTSNRNLSVDITGTTAESVVAGTDEILIWDASVSALRKMTRTNFVLSEAEVDAFVANNGYLTTESDTLATVTARGTSTAVNITMDSRAELRLADTAGGEYLAMKAPATIGSSYTLVWPDNDGSASGQVLTTDGSGVLSWTTPAAVGEVNTASNQGLGGVGVFKQKTVADLEFKNINAGSNKISITNDAPNSEIDVDVVQANIDHDALANFAANEHIDHSTVSIATGANSGLSGGGNLTTTRNIAVDISGSTAETVPASNDELLIYDTSATALRKMTRANFLTGYLQSSIGASAGTVMGADAVPNCGASQKLQMSLGPTYLWSCVSEAVPAVISDTDNDTKIQVEEAADEDHIRFDTAGTERMIILNTGNVGIGTTVPSSSLQVSSNASTIAMVESAGTSVQPQFVTRQARGTLASPSASQLDDVLGWFGARGYGTSAYATTSSAGMFVKAAENYTNSAQGGYLTFETNNTGTTARTEKMRLTASGSLGIGTTTPAAPLDINGAVKVGTSVLTCSATTSGSIRYNSTNNVMEFCNGSTWNLMQAPACTDTTPNSFTFTNQANQALSTLVTSNIVQVTGMNCAINTAVSGPGSPQYRTCSDASCVTVLQDWTSGTSSMNNNEYIQVRQTSAASGGVTNFATVLVGAMASAWSVATAGDCSGLPSTPPPVGTVCADGTVYAGLSPDGNVPMFTQRCDLGQSWDGANCTGTKWTQAWNDGTANYQSTGYTNTTTGEANTNGIAVFAGTDAPYTAALNCYNLSENGYTDWYLPARSELSVLYTGNAAIRNFTTSGSFYWSSTENSSGQASAQRFSDGLQSSLNKNTAYLVRCVRR